MHFRESLWKALLANGFEVYAFAPIDAAAEILEKKGVKVLDLPLLKRYVSIPLSDYFLYRYLCKYYQMYRPDMILHFTIKLNIFGSLAAGNTNSLSVATITGLGTSWLNGRLLKWVTQLLYRHSLPLANIVVGQNAQDIEALQKIGVKAKQWQLIPGSGVDMDHFCADSKPKENTFVFLFIGRMLIDKGVEELFDAWQEVHGLLPHAELHLLGGFDEKHPRCISKERWQRDLQLPRLVYHSFKKDVRPYIRKADVVILPSYREGVPRSLLEAMAMSRPVIATNVPGCRELAIPGKTGWRIEARSSGDLAKKLQIACKTASKELEMYGENGQRMITDRYSNKIVASHYLQIIHQLLAEKNTCQ